MASETRTRVTQSQRRRSDIEIMANILKEAFNNVGKTRIMYKCNLSHRQLLIYLKLLLDMNLLTSFPSKHYSQKIHYTITNKGRKFLEAYRTIEALMA